MIAVRIRRDPAGAIRGFRVEGHAGYDVPGRDIVCAGVSALVETALLGLRHVAGVPVQVHKSQPKGLVDCQVGRGTPEAEARAQAILETLALGLKDIEKDYGRYIRVTEGG